VIEKNEGRKEMTNEPLITWNLLLCLVAFPSLGWFIRRELTNIQDSAKERSAELTRKIERIQDCMTLVKRDVEQKVDRDDCEAKGAEKWERIYHHKHNDAGEVVVVR